MGRSVASHYEILEKIGEGGYGEVYRARDLHLPRDVALKFVYPHLVVSERAIARFQQEARAIAALNHPNIVVLHDFDTDPETGRLFLVLEYLGGGTLRQAIERHAQAGLALNPFELLRCATAVAAGLSHAHRRRIVHRDVKSSNVMFSEERAVKITDFGIAKSDESGAITEPGCTPGTVSYMSPEQARGMEMDHRTDIFSLGIVLYEMATGRLPFTAASSFEVLQQIVTEPTPPLRQARPDLPAELEQIVQRATAKLPSGRYQDMEQLETDLLAVQQRLQTLSGQPTVVLGPVESRPVVRPRPGPRGRKVVVLAMLAMLAAALLGVLWFRAGRQPVGEPQRAAQLMAVIPFHCLAKDDAQRAFCEGLAHRLSTKVTQMEPFQDRVVVVPYSEVRREGVTSATDARKIFKVQLALTGSVEFIEDTVRVIVNLVDAEHNVQTGSHKLDSSTARLLSLQDEISDLAAGMLEVRLGAADRQRVNAGETRSEAAFEAFVRGVGHLGNSGVEEARRAVGLLEEAVSIDPLYAAAHAHLGQAYLRLYRPTEDGRWVERARASCERALKIDPRLADAHITMAEVWLERTDPARAIDEAKIALTIEPKNAEALRTLGNAYARLARREPARRKEAIDTLNRAISLRPELWTTYRDLCLAYYRMGDNQKAEQQMLLMLEFTQSAEAYSTVGALYHLMDRPDDAIAYLKKSLAIKPIPQAYANLGTVNYYLGRYADVIPNFENALRLSEETRTTNHVIWGNLAMAYMSTPGMEAKALDAYREAIRIAQAKLAVSPQDAGTHASLANYLANTGDSKGALRHAKEAMRLEPGSAAVLFRCGLVYERLKRRDQALKTIGRAIELGHPLKEVLHAGDLAALREDPRFQKYVRR